MSQGPRTRVRLDGKTYRVIRSSRGIQIYQRQEGTNMPRLLIWNSRDQIHQPATDALAARILAAEAESV